MLIMHNYAVNHKFKCLQYQSPIFGYRERDAPSCDDHVTPSTVVRDLGIFLDSDVSMRAQVSRTVSRCFHTVSYTHLTLPTIYSV